MSISLLRIRVQVDAPRRKSLLAHHSNRGVCLLLGSHGFRFKRLHCVTETEARSIPISRKVGE
ncbi:hypothetical protein RB10589 [Rhodopirellula baltica SH 1]|uniref:Uncharacterized protein n=1 Tax=Rhodopirellula baltica (strain DSM 10527 / NCIMB 13988 / SH1) TaxID=243090 RepID=Q7UES4_RHOBA|nr:hypothetical protein RB10589 [Rhodopirellula baltica SH 1]